MSDDSGHCANGTEQYGTRWGSECPQCGHLEKRDSGPGTQAKAPRCPECDWPMNCVDLDYIDQSIDADTNRQEGDQ